MKIDINKKILNANLDRWLFEADYINETSIKIFVYAKHCFGNKFIGYYNPQNGDIRPLYYNSHIDYRNGWKPTTRQLRQIEKYCNRLTNKIK